MGTMVIIARLLHITSGVIWVGAVFFANIFLTPVVAGMGPDGGKVMKGLADQKYFQKIIMTATITILSGLYLVWVDSGGFAPEWFRTRIGMGFSTGMLLALVAFTIGITIVRPIMGKMTAMGGELATASPDAKPAIVARMDATRAQL